MKLNLVGVDVSAKTVTVIIDHDGTRSEAFDLDNDPKGHMKLIRMVTKKGFQARVVLEAQATTASTSPWPCTGLPAWRSWWPTHAP